MKRRLAGAVTVLVALATMGAAGAADAPAGWRGWDRYQVIMWSTGAPKDPAAWMARLKELEFTAEETGRGSDPAPFLKNAFGFYVENLVPELGFLNNRRALYDADYQGYAATRDKAHLHRKPCFDDPAFWAEKQRALPALVRPYVGSGPLLYDLRDELSIGSFASPMDYCFCPHTLRAFRGWLRQRYGSLQALNAEWGTELTSWDTVEPMTTWEVKDREKAALAAGRPENYAPWADHREYMDQAFADAIARMREMIRGIDPNTPVGIEGTQMPSAWGGYDLWRLSKATDWVEPYDIASSREIFRSFLPARAPILATVFGNDYRNLQAQLWRLLLHGDRGCIVWDDERSRCVEKETPGLAPTARGKAMAPIFSGLKRIAPELIPLERLDDGIAIHYSHASIRAHWMFDSREDGATWHRRFSSYESTHSRYARARDSMLRLVEDLGLQYRFISYEQVASGELEKSRTRVLLLPQSVAMSAEECRRVREFVRAGGTVIADTMTATMDEHLRRLPTGQLDDLFGIRRPDVGWRAAPEGKALPGSPAAAALRVFEPGLIATTGRPLLGEPGAVFQRRFGKGRAIYLNLDLRPYGRDRLAHDGELPALALFRRLLSEGGIAAPVRVTRAADGQPARCVEVWRYRGKNASYVAVMRNPEFAADSLGPVGYKSSPALEQPETIEVHLPTRAHVADLRTGTDFGRTDRVRVTRDPWAPVILKQR